ncbi:470_t:CDS:10, partial [Funneliformis caledonium]
AILHETRANHYYVKFTSSPFDSSVDHIDAQHANFHKELNKLGINIKIKDVFKRYANGISIETDEHHVKRIAEIEHVESIDIVKIYKRINLNEKKFNQRAYDYTNLPDNVNSVHEMTGVKRVHEELKLSGKGVKVGIIDSGIDYTHPALGGCYGPGCRVAFGYNFVDDNDDPYDCLGHGTHVAAIVGGDLRVNGSGFVGVAPDVIFGAYKIFPCMKDEATDITIMKAILKAVDDGMDVINMSFTGVDSKKTFLVTLINDLIKYKRTIFVASIGNKGGRNGLFTIGMPANSQQVIGVCSFETNKVITFKAFDPKNPKFVINYMTQDVSAFPFQNAKIKLLPKKCIHDYKDFKNTIIIKDNRVENKCSQVIDATKLLGVIVINNKFKEGTLPAPPIAVINTKEADMLIKYLEKNPNLELDFSDKHGYIKPHPFAETPSVFSGWGLAEDLDIKPEICGPGGLIFSAFPVNNSTYRILSGTKFRKQNQQQFSEQLKTALMNYAIPREERNKLLASVLRQVAGLVDAYNMLTATSFAYPPKINLNDTKRDEIHLPAPSVNGYNKTFIRNYYQLEYYTRQYASVKFDNDQITVPPGSSVDVLGWLEIMPLDENKPKLTVPYAGLADDARSLPLFQTPKFPALYNYDSKKSIQKKDPIKTFTFKLLNITSGLRDYPSIHLNFTTPTQAVFTEILDVNHHLLGSMNDKKYFPFQKDILEIPKIISWDGFILSEPVSNGKYFIRVRALKMFGDINNEKDYEVWDSPKFRIERHL